MRQVLAYVITQDQDLTLNMTGEIKYDKTSKLACVRFFSVFKCPHFIDSATKRQQNVAIF